nr:glycosyltransferase [Cytophagales bacterium]
MKIVFIGLTISSSWGNGHATTYRALLEELYNLGHEVHFLEHDKPYYANARDISEGLSYSLCFYSSIDELDANYRQLIKNCDLLVVGSYVSQGTEVIDWALATAQNSLAFYDIDTPVTLDKLAKSEYEYLRPDQIPAFDFYLSFSGGRALEILEETYKAKRALPLYCAVNPADYRPLNLPKEWLLGYLGTYSEDRQSNLNMLLLDVASRIDNKSFVVAGPGFPDRNLWSENVQTIEHLPPNRHVWFYNSQVATVNVTREAMRKLGHSPSIRLFEAAACGIPIFSDEWEGLSDFFEINKEIFVCNSTDEVIHLLNSVSAEELQRVGNAARRRILQEHTAAHRAQQLINYYADSPQIQH